MTESKIISDKNNLTTGKPLKKILLFTIPVFIGFIFQQFYSIVDAVIVDRTLGQTCFSAVGITGSLSFLVLGFAQGIAAGFSVVTSQYFGAKDNNQVRKSIATSFILCIAVIVVLTVLSVIFTRQMLQALNTPEKYFEYSYSYISTIFYGIGASILYNMVAYILRSLGDSRTPLYFLIVACVINIGLDFLFILPFNMGIAGAGWATVLSQLLAGIACMIYMFIKYPFIRLKREDWKTSFSFCMKHMRLAVPMGFQFSTIAIGIMIQQSAINSLGDDVVTAYTAASRIDQLAIQPICALGTTMATYCGQNYGAQQYERLRKGVRQSALLGLLISVAATLIVSLLGKQMTYLFISTATVRQTELCQQYLRYQGAFYILLMAIYVYRNSLQGINYSSITVVAGILELTMRSVAAFVLVKILGFVGVCLSNPIAWLGSDMILLPAYAFAVKKFKKLEADRQSQNMTVKNN